MDLVWDIVVEKLVLSNERHASYILGANSFFLGSCIWQYSTTDRQHVIKGLMYNFTL